MLTPSETPISFEIRRVVVSVPLPAANGSTSVMLRFGYGACADAADVSPAKITAKAAAARKRCVDSEIIRFRLPWGLLGAFLMDLLPATLACPKPKRKPPPR